MIYTVGYGGFRKLEQLKEMMEEKRIDVLVDVRTSPKAWCNEFYGHSLAREFGLRYVWKGKELGGLDGRISEAAISEVARLGERQNILIMCAEKDPARCHRHYEIAARLYRKGITAVHLIPGPSGVREVRADYIPFDRPKGGEK